MLLVDPVRRAILARRGRRHAEGDGFGDVVVQRGPAGARRPRADRAAHRRLRPGPGSRAAQRRQPAPLRRGAVGTAAAGAARRARAGAGRGAAGPACSSAGWRWRAGAGPAAPARWLIPVAWVLPSLALGPAIAAAASGPAIARGPLVIFSLAVAATAWHHAPRHPVVPARLAGLAPRLAAGGAADSGVAALPGARRRRRSRQDAPRRGRLRQAGAQPPRGPARRSSSRAQSQIDRVAGPAGSDRVGGRASAPARRPKPAFTVWRSTELEEARLTSAIELYGADGVARQPLRAQLPRGRGRAAAAPDVELRVGRLRRSAAVRRRRAPHAARRARPVRRRRQGRRAHRRRRSSPT